MTLIDTQDEDRLDAPVDEGRLRGEDLAVRDRKRFTRTALVAAGLVTIPYAWILFALWGSPNLFRQTIYEDNFYDLQARAMFHGHLWIPNGSIGIEGFFHAGREYTYFGVFPSVLRMPVLLFTSRFDGRLTAPSMFIAWSLTVLVVPMLVWRIRGLIRGQAALGWSECIAYGVFIATSLGGTVLLELAANPYVFSEDLAWSICLAVAGIFVLLGILERPTTGQVAVGLVVLLAANSNRVTTGWALAGAAVLIAVYFGLGWAGVERKRWAWRVAAVGLVPLAVGCAVNYAKFGMLFGVSNFDQEWTRVNAYRRQFLASNHDSESGTVFIPTTLLTYLRPDGIHFSSVFPYITLPVAPPRAVGGVLFDRLYRTASIPASMPMAFLLGCWGVITAFRPHPVGRVHLTRILLLASAGSGALLFVWGYIADRYLADFLPFFILASAIGLVDIWRRLDGRSARLRRSTLGVIGIVGIYGIIANIGIASTPNEEWGTGQTANFVRAQQSLSSITGNPLEDMVQRGDELPPWAPAGQLFVVGACAGLYVSNGENYSTVPSQQFSRTTWQTVERGVPFVHEFGVTYGRTSEPAYAELVSVGSETISASSLPSSRAGTVIAVFDASGGRRPMASVRVPVAVGSTHDVQVVTDTAKHNQAVYLDGREIFDNQLLGAGPITAHPLPTGRGLPLSVVRTTSADSDAALCRSLVG